MNKNLQEMTLDELLSRLKPRERNYIFNVRAGMRQGEAAKEAGFPEKSADVQASRLMQREDVLLILNKLYELDCKKLCISADSIIVRANDMYQRCMQATPVLEFDRETGEWRKTGEYQFDSRGAGKALEIICKVAGLEKKEVELKAAPTIVNFTVQNDDQSGNK